MKFSSHYSRLEKRVVTFDEEDIKRALKDLANKVVNVTDLVGEKVFKDGDNILMTWDQDDTTDRLTVTLTKVYERPEEGGEKVNGPD